MKRPETVEKEKYHALPEKAKNKKQLEIVYKQRICWKREFYPNKSFFPKML
jgi:hypothetical protein